MSRELTKEEVQSLFIQHLRNLVNYWADLPDSEKVGRGPNWRYNGLVHSILSTFDGNTPLPGFVVSPAPHETDKAFHAANGENWFPKDCDIAGELNHEWTKELSMEPAPPRV